MISVSFYKNNPPTATFISTDCKFNSEICNNDINVLNSNFIH